MTYLISIIVCFFAGMGAGLGTGFAGMSAAAVITPMQFASLKRPAQLFLRTDGTVVDTNF